MSIAIEWLGQKSLGGRLNKLGEGQCPVHAMDGMGNMFLIIDERGKAHPPSDAQIIDLAQSELCDQILAISNGEESEQLMMRVWNKDGSRAGNCGNGARCVAWLYFAERNDRTDTVKITIDASGGMDIQCEKPAHDLGYKDNHLACVFPIKQQAKSDDAIKNIACEMIGKTELLSAKKIDLGNPHVVLHVKDGTDVFGLARAYGEQLEDVLKRKAICPNGVNIGFASARQERHGHTGTGSTDLQVWERGAGLTKSCGSGAVAYQACHHSSESRRIFPSLLHNRYYIASEETINGEPAIRLSGDAQYEDGGILTFA